MEIPRVFAQAPETLEEHYSQLRDDPRTAPDYREMGRRMLELLSHVPDIDGPPVRAMTSHANLLLVTTDDPARRLVAIRGHGNGEGFSFCIEFPMPAGEAPWPDAVVQLPTHDVLQACEMVAYGLSKATGTTYTFHGRTRPNRSTFPECQEAQEW